MIFIMIPFRNRPYSLRKSRQILRQVHALFRKQAKNLSEDQSSSIEKTLRDLDQAVLEGNRDEANRLARKAESFSSEYFTRTIWETIKEISVALSFALVIAIVVRSMWFELYEIPTGSMRPTFREKDRLTVTKTAFGINVPLKTDHFYFDPDLVQRGSVVIWSGDGIPLPDTTASYFGVIPYTKRYIKRLIGKPGDTLYFYGGKIYGIDKEGNPINDLRDTPWMKPLEHIPFMKYEQDVRSTQKALEYLQMHQPIARLYFSPFGELRREVNNGSEWVAVQDKSSDSKVQTFRDLWGIGNYALASLMTEKELRQYSQVKPESLEKAPLYLVLQHSPSLPKGKSGSPQVSAMMKTEESVIPLQEKQLQALMDTLYTARFVVQNERASRYSAEGSHHSLSNPYFPGVPDGTYEFYFGKGYKVHWGGVLTELPADHPLMQRDPAMVQKLYNMGIEMTTDVMPRGKHPVRTPNRYAYFRDGDLYLMGSPVYMKDDPLLVAFLEREKKKEKPFVDRGPPKDEAFIRTFGLKIPDNQYLVLGDNHAMSADSRAFGFVPQANLQGAPSLILWPPGDRFGVPSQKAYSLFVLPRMIVWLGALIAALIGYVIVRARNKRSLF